MGIGGARGDNRTSELKVVQRLPIGLGAIASFQEEKQNRTADLSINETGKEHQCWEKAKSAGWEATRTSG